MFHHLEIQNSLSNMMGVKSAFLGLGLGWGGMGHYAEV